MITFCEYMRQSLGHSGTGYYTSRACIGHEGADFYTAPETSPAFASLLALQIIELDVMLGFPDPFYLIEAGPGNGTLADSLLTIFQAAHPALYERIAPRMYELPGVLADRQKDRLSKFSVRHGLRWVDPGSSEMETDPPGAGLVFGNEFLDALPVHRIRMGEKGWEECYIDRSEDESREVWGDLSCDSLALELAESFRQGTRPKRGQEVEICLDIPKILGRLDRFLSRGYMLWIDYGDIREELYSERRIQGTLRSYRNHHVTDNLLSGPQGESDLTAFVDFSRVASALGDLGYEMTGYTDQMSWLMGLGFEQWLEANADRLTSEETLNAGTLLHPLKMGRIFKVLLMGKRLDGSGPEYTGFRFGGLRPPL